MKHRYLLFFLILFTSCFRVPENSIVGSYVSKNTSNTIDSLVIKSDRTYTNSIYRKFDNSLIFVNQSTWKYEDGYIIFHKFFEDGDLVYSKEEFYFDNVLIDTQLPLEWNGTNVVIHYLAGRNDIYFEKQKIAK